MSAGDSTLDPVALARARALLVARQPRERVWPVLGAAAFAACSAMALAVAMILAPPPTHPPADPAPPRSATR